jgi:signal transduction histidine kinase/CheY-like chemotaxis protein
VDRGTELSVRESESAVIVLLLVPDAECASIISKTLGSRYDADVIRVELGEASPEDAITRARRQIGGNPLGFVALNEVDALEAISSGADEILIWPARDDKAINGFFDRTKARASLRKGTERTSAAAAHAEKLAALGTLVAGVAHEINNPLTALQLSVAACVSLMTPLTKLVSELSVWSSRGWGATPEQVQALYAMGQNGAPRVEGQLLLDEMLAASASIASVVRDLRVFARSDSDREEAQLLDANELIDQSLRLVGRELGTAAHIERDYSRELPRVVVPHGRLTQVLVNILVNAVHAIREVERPVHRIRLSTRSDGEFVAISISDTGPGIAPEAVDHIFDPFFTTKRTGYGTGLGLSISRSIMHDLGGDLIVESVHGEGATFIALLPLPDHATVRQAYLRSKNPGVTSSAPPRQTVLVVDDDERILKAYARVLAGSCDVLMASDGQEAIELLSSGSTADALVTELSLPDVDGQALFEWVRQERPSLAQRTVFVAAEATRERYKTFLAGLGNCVLTKPVTANSLWAALNTVSRADVTTETMPPL